MDGRCDMISRRADWKSSVWVADAVEELFRPLFSAIGHGEKAEAQKCYREAQHISDCLAHELAKARVMFYRRSWSVDPEKEQENEV